ncbi:hypothetical protein GR183_21225 [Stappia sp. GBMRC 2046]|uniref:AAA family ATPase n=1 Tax=Stappia sediminis TaxID=2692190 RepID=A0A7X3LYH7_9HYPH|nr:polysaccharide biosynthesis tyrosine autokinase [Stappia sediminis]MXN67437.1 hypothetical protein [Stappia sediminis]
MLEKITASQKGYPSGFDADEVVKHLPASSSVMGIREILSIIRRRFALFVCIGLVSTISLILMVSLMKDIYTASATFVLERDEAGMLEAVTQIQSETLDLVAIETEMDIVSSRIFAGKVVDEMNLVNDPWFNTYLPSDESEEPSFFAKNIESLRAWLEKNFGIFPEEAVAPLPDIAEQRDRTISRLLANLGVSRNGQTLAVTVRTDAPNAVLAANLANTIARIYVDLSRENTRKAMSDAVGFLRERANKIAKRLAENERTIATIIQEHQLSPDSRDDVVRQRIDGLNAQLTTARVELAGVKARKEQAQLIMEGNKDLETSAVESSLLGTLRAEQARLLRERAQYSTNFGSNHPEVIKTNAELESVGEMITDEMRRINDELSVDERIVEDRVRRLEAQITGWQETVHNRSFAEIRMRELEREVKADQKLHDLVLARIGSLDPFAELARASARVVSYAEVPRAPSYPQKKQIIAGGVIGVMTLSMILAILMEASDTRIRSVRQIVSATQLPVMAVVPKASQSFLPRKRALITKYLTNHRTLFAEAMRSIYFAFRAQAPLNSSKVMFTAPLPGCGTTSTALGFSICAARDGISTIYVNLDPRVFDLSKFGPAVSKDEAQSQETKTGQGTLKDCVGAIQIMKNVPGLDLLAASGLLRRDGFNGPFQTREVNDLLNQLAAKYDLIVVDCAPVLIVEDSSLLATFVDAVILVTQFGRTKEQDLNGAVDRLRINHAPLIGTVLNQVDPRAQTVKEPLGAISYPHEAKGYFTM